MKRESCPVCFYILVPCRACGATRCKGCQHTCQPGAVEAYQGQKRAQARIKMRGYRANWRLKVEESIKEAISITQKRIDSQIAKPPEIPEPSVIRRKQRSR